MVTGNRRTKTPAVPPPAAMKLGKLAPGFRLTHPERVIDAESGTTKGELVAYYTSVAELILPHLQERPVALLRATAGIGGTMFFQKHVGATPLPHVDLLDPALDPGHPALLSIGTPDGLLSAAQMNTIELHTWNATVKAITQPDRIVFDLDPGEGAAWAQVQEAALLVRAALDDLGLKCWLKTSGGKGLHVVVPLAPKLPWETVKAFAQTVVQQLHDAIPQRIVAKSGAKNRVGKIYVDYLRNGWGATTASAWSARARAGIGLSVPVGWDELETLSSGAHWTVQNVASRLAIGNAPWDGYASARQSLTQAMKALAKHDTSKETT